MSSLPAHQQGWGAVRGGGGSGKRTSDWDSLQGVVEKRRRKRASQQARDWGGTVLPKPGATTKAWRAFLWDAVWPEAQDPVSSTMAHLLVTVDSAQVL